jgi:hypothetical protein
MQLISIESKSNENKKMQKFQYQKSIPLTQKYMTSHLVRYTK